MIDLEDLGSYPDRGRGPPRGLTLHDLGELLRRLGRAHDFEVQSEFRRDGSSKRAIDWVWLRRGRVRAAFEIEGRDVDYKSAKADVAKLTCPRLAGDGRALRAIVFFQVNHDLNPKSDKGDPMDRVSEWSCFRDRGVRCYRDVDLLEQKT
ncbi:MAG: hypothetical protein ACREJ3_11675, partial [Polyangiaceae bacterium]